MKTKELQIAPPSRRRAGGSRKLPEASRPGNHLTVNRRSLSPEGLRIETFTPVDDNGTQETRNES